MRAVVVMYFPRSAARVALMSAIAAGAAGCSADTSRFNDNPFTNPYTTSENAGGGTPQAAPVARVESKPLQGQPLSPPTAGVAANQHVAKAEIAAPAPARLAPPAASPVARAHDGQAHVVAPGETLSSIARKYHTPVKEIVTANRLTYDAQLKIGEHLIIPGAKTAAAPAQAAVVAEETAPAKPAPAAAPNPKVASLEQPSVRVATPAAEAKGEDTASTGNVSGTPAFRWPVRGRVISGFGPLTNGQQNDGINLAVPEGTPVKAAETREVLLGYSISTPCKGANSSSNAVVK